jgi:ADP-heptose:LPS heptosyltransferase
LNLIGIKTEDKALSLKIDNGIIRGEDIALHPFTSDPVKQWPIQNFRELAQRLVKELNKKVIIVGGKEELTRGGAYFDNLGAGIVNMTGKTTLIQLASLLKKCGLLISGDSGPVHLACAVGTRVLALFRNDLPAKSAKRWGPWGEGHSVIEKPNLADISVDEVLGKVKEGLG